MPTLVDYLIPNPVSTYILKIYNLVWLDFIAYHPCWYFNRKSSLYIYIKIYDLVWLGLYGITTLMGILKPNPVYTYILKIYELVWLGLYGISTLMSILKPNPVYTYILKYMSWFGWVFMANLPLWVF